MKWLSSVLSSQGEGHAAAGLTLDSDLDLGPGPEGPAGLSCGRGAAGTGGAHREGCLVRRISEHLGRLHGGHLQAESVRVREGV